jgi:hypothetical protein
MDAAALQRLRNSRWTPEKAWKWYRGIGPIRGFNYVPRTAVNTTEMWQGETFDPRTIDEELGWAERCGLNSARVFVQYIVYESDPQGLLGRMERFLEIAEKHHESVMFILFDDCFIPEPKLGKQPDPVPGVHNSQWTASPGDRRKQPENWSALEKYVKHVVGHFAKDQRIVAWDLYNEAAAPSRPLVEASFAWARAVQPSQPLTSCWQALDLSDVISFHDYGPPIAGRLDRWIAERPALCTECIARGAGSRFDNVLPAFAKRGIGWYMWGLVKGRIQTYYPWGSPKGAPEPKLWHHDLLRPDGTPYRPEEIEQIGRFRTEFTLPNRTGINASGPAAATALPSLGKTVTQPYPGVTARAGRRASRASAPNRPLHDLLHPLAVTAPLGFDVRRQVLAQGEGLEWQPKIIHRYFDARAGQEQVHRGVDIEVGQTTPTPVPCRVIFCRWLP